MRIFRTATIAMAIIAALFSGTSFSSVQRACGAMPKDKLRIPQVSILSAQVLQTRGATTAVKRIQVNTKTITALPTGKKFVVDLTRRGVRYEFDAKAGVIDFSRVVVLTAKGEVAFRSYLEKTIRKDKLPTLTDVSLSLVIGSRANGTFQPLPRSGSNVLECPPGTGPNNSGCHCNTEHDCQILLDRICVTYVCYTTAHLVYCECT